MISNNNYGSNFTFEQNLFLCVQQTKFIKLGVSGLGYIGVDLLRDILKELEPSLKPSDLNEMIKEIDTDNSGTVDWEGKLHVFVFVWQLQQDINFQ